MIPDTYHSNAHISARIDVHLANAISSMQSSDFAVTVHNAPFFRLLFPRTPDYPYWSIFVHRDRPTNLSKNSPTLPTGLMSLKSNIMMKATNLHPEYRDSIGFTLWLGFHH